MLFKEREFFVLITNNKVISEINEGKLFLQEDFY